MTAAADLEENANMDEQSAMKAVFTVEAIYEAGALKPLSPLPSLKEHDRVRITVEDYCRGLLSSRGPKSSLALKDRPTVLCRSAAS